MLVRHLRVKNLYLLQQLTKAARSSFGAYQPPENTLPDRTTRVRSHNQMGKLVGSASVGYYEYSTDNNVMGSGMNKRGLVESFGFSFHVEEFKTLPIL